MSPQLHHQLQATVLHDDWDIWIWSTKEINNFQSKYSTTWTISMCQWFFVQWEAQRIWKWDISHWTQSTCVKIQLDYTLIKLYFPALWMKNRFSWLWKLVTWNVPILKAAASYSGRSSDKLPEGSHWIEWRTAHTWDEQELLIHLLQNDFNNVAFKINYVSLRLVVGYTNVVVACCN